MFELKCMRDAFEGFKYVTIVKQMWSLYQSIKNEKWLFEEAWNYIRERAILISAIDLQRFIRGHIDR